MSTSRRCSLRIRRLAAAAAITATLVVAATGCGGAPNSPAAITAADIDAALQKESTIIVWTWAPQVKDIVAAFEKQYPKVKVNLVNAGTGTDEYTKLQDAIKTGSGVPDVAQIEYYALPEFALDGSLVNLRDYSFDDLRKDYSPAVWDRVSIYDGIQGLPQDTGPMALFYNKAVFDKYGIAVPSTWDQYVAAGRKLHAADRTKYITNDTGDAGFTTSMIWDAGGQPYKIISTKNVTINLQDEGTQKFTRMWNKLLQAGLLAPTATWSDEWYDGLAKGTIASLIIGAWMPANLESGVPSGAGKWRAAPMPTWRAGDKPATAQNGGSSDAVLKQSRNPLAAAGFLKFMNDGPGSTILTEQGGFPAAEFALQSQTFLDAAPTYFGGQKINQVLSQAAGSVIPGWSYLPFQVFANSVFGDTVGQAYEQRSDLNAGLRAWQAKCTQYGARQGFAILNN